MTTNQDKAINYLDNKFSRVEEGDSPFYFFSKMKEDLPNDLEESVRNVIIEQCDSFKDMQGSTKIGYMLAYNIIKKRIKSHYREFEYQTVA